MALNLKDVTLLEKLSDSEWQLKDLREKLTKKKDLPLEEKSTEKKEEIKLKKTDGKTVLVEVTQEDINFCLEKRVGSYNPCPITRKLKKMFPTSYIFVNYGVIMADKKYLTPPEVTQFMLDWDRQERPVKPFKFILKS
jgi:hypothetical protein